MIYFTCHPLRVSLARARSLFRPLLPSACYTGYVIVIVRFNGTLFSAEAALCRRKKGALGKMGRGKRGSEASAFPLFPLAPTHLLLFIHGYPAVASGGGESSKTIKGKEVPSVSVKIHEERGHEGWPNSAT